jgi:pyruvate dehydrogenase E2 component (dihydrolipoamide acetyltransferase)
MAQSHGVNLGSIQGTGPNGRIIRADIEDALNAGPIQQASPILDVPSASFIDLPNS